MLRSCYRLRRSPLLQHSSLLVCLLLLTFLSACSQEESPASQTSQKTPTSNANTSPAFSLQKHNTLLVGSYTSYLPQEFVDPHTKMVVGFDIDLINALARRMDLQTQIVHIEFNALLDSVQTKYVDLAISALPITAEAQKRALFVPYLKGGESLLVQKGNPHQIQDVGDLCGLAVGVRIGTLEENDLRVADEVCKQHGDKPITLIALHDQFDVIELLLAKQVVATYQDAPVSDYYSKQNPSLFEIGGPIANPNVEGIAVHKDEQVLFHALQGAFKALQADGTYHYLIMKWGLINGELNVK